MFLEMTIQGKQWLKLIKLIVSIFTDNLKQTKTVLGNCLQWTIMCDESNTKSQKFDLKILRIPLCLTCTENTQPMYLYFKFTHDIVRTMQHVQQQQWIT